MYEPIIFIHLFQLNIHIPLIINFYTVFKLSTGNIARELVYFGIVFLRYHWIFNMYNLNSDGTAGLKFPSTGSIGLS